MPPPMLRFSTYFINTLVDPFPTTNIITDGPILSKKPKVPPLLAAPRTKAQCLLERVDGQLYLAFDYLALLTICFQIHRENQCTTFMNPSISQIFDFALLIMSYYFCTTGLPYTASVNFGGQSWRLKCGIGSCASSIVYYILNEKGSDFYWTGQRRWRLGLEVNSARAECHINATFPINDQAIKRHISPIRLRQLNTPSEQPFPQPVTRMLLLNFLLVFVKQVQMDIPLRPNTIIWYGTKLCVPVSHGSFQGLILQITPTVDRPGLTFQPNRPSNQETTTTELFPAVVCWDAATQASPQNYYPIEHQYPKNLVSRSSTIPSDSWSRLLFKECCCSICESGSQCQWHQQNKSEIVALAEKAINYLHYTCL